MAPIPPDTGNGGVNPALPPDPAFAQELALSHLRLSGVAISAWTDPCPIVAHGVEADPIFRWANPAALALWETDWATFTRLPSRLSAAPEDEIQADRSRWLAEAAARGYVEGYRGIRQSLTGRRFRITATLWTLPGLGQAARITQVERLD